MRYALIILSLVFLPEDILHAQVGKCPQLPLTYDWVTPADYEKDTELVKQTLRWLCRTPLRAELQKQSLANAYVMEWLAGTPSITLEVETKYLPFVEDHPELLFTFIHGMAYYCLNHPETKNQVRLYLEGFKVVANLAAQSKELSKSPSLKSLLKAAKKNVLKEYTMEIIEKQGT